jgi:D-alanine-D-alanine ligase-like ATP-grasp enzyme/acylphosphatase
VRNLKVDLLSRAFYIVSDGTRETTFWDDTPDTTTFVARRISVSKALTKAVLKSAGIEVPSGGLFGVKERRAGWRYAQSLGLPVVVKPARGSYGSGVTTNVTSEDEFRRAWSRLQRSNLGAAKVIVEKHLHGRDFRLYVVGDRVVAATWRHPAYVEGDGRRSIVQLIADKDTVRRLNPSAGRRVMTLNPVVIANLHARGLAPHSVLEAGRRVTLQSVANVAAGGESVDVTDEIHPDFEEIAVRSCKALPGAINAGVDVLVEDISAPPSGQEWAVCEVNTCAQIALHHFPVAGTPRDAAGALIEHLFPGSRRYGPDEQRWAHAAISGMVIGVGFRTWIWQRANLRGLTGWVRNRDENSVEAVFCGAPNAVESMLEACRSGPRKAVVADVATDPWTGPPGEEFRVRS